MIGEVTRLVRSSDPLTKTVDGETVMFNPTRGQYFALGAVGSRVWDLLEAPITFAELCTRLQAEFMVDDATCRADVVPFLEELLAAKLLEATS